MKSNNLMVVVNGEVFEYDLSAIAQVIEQLENTDARFFINGTEIISDGEGVDSYSEEEWKIVVAAKERYYEDNCETLRLIREAEEEEYPEYPISSARDRAYRRYQNALHSTGRPTNSCLRKGYHKSEKLWKRATRRGNRHSSRAELNNRQFGINWDAVRDYIVSSELIHWDDTSIGWLGFDQWRNIITGETKRGISAICISEWSDDEDTYHGVTNYYLSDEDLVKMGFVE